MSFLRIFSWLLLTFGVVGFGAVVLGLVPDIGAKGPALVLLLVQSIFAGAVVYGFRLVAQERLSPRILFWGGWAVIITFVICGQIWISRFQINL